MLLTSRSPLESRVNHPGGCGVTGLAWLGRLGVMLGWFGRFDGVNQQENQETWNWRDTWDTHPKIQYISVYSHLFNIFFACLCIWWTRDHCHLDSLRALWDRMVGFFFFFLMASIGDWIGNYKYARYRSNHSSSHDCTYSLILIWFASMCSCVSDGDAGP